MHAHVQYTLRNVPHSVDAALRRRAKIESKGLNEIILEALKLGVGLGEQSIQFDDLDSLAGTWQEDAAFDRAIAAQQQVDSRLWKSGST